MRLFLLLLLIPVFCFSQKSLKPKKNKPLFQIEKLTEGLIIPWGMEFLSEKQIILTERNGRLSLFDLDRKSLTRLKGGPLVENQGQGGLLDVKKHPNYPKSPWIYVTYSKRQDSSVNTALARFQIEGSQIVSLSDLFVSSAPSDTSRHFGSRIAFDENNDLYMSIGERGLRKNAQDLSNHGGSIVRLREDGRVPPDNPFVKNKKARPEIWSYGHRNPQGLVYDFEAKQLWAMEHGPRGGDELNRIQKGHNYGWPKQSYGKEYWGPKSVGKPVVPGMTAPIYQFTPSIAPCGLELYSGKQFPEWKNSFFSGSLKLVHLNRLVVKNNVFEKEERLLTDLQERVRAVREGPEGFLYLTTDSGNLYRITPSKTK